MDKATWLEKQGRTLGPLSQRILELLVAHQHLVEGHDRVTVEFNAQGSDVSIRTSQYNRPNNK